MVKGNNSLDWIVSDTVLSGGNFVILVSINNTATNLDYSDGTFSITSVSISPTPTPPPPSSSCDGSVGRVEVKEPNTGWALNVFDTVTIKWCLNDFSQYSQANSSIWLTTRTTQANGTYIYRNQLHIASNVAMTPGENTLDWTIPKDFTLIIDGVEETFNVGGGDYVILVTINSFSPNFDHSDGTFTILNSTIPNTGTGSTSFCDNSSGSIEVIAPDGGESYHVLDTIQLKWCLNDFTQYSLEYSELRLASKTTQGDGSSIYRNLAPILDNEVFMNSGENTYNWVIPKSYTVVVQGEEVEVPILSGGDYVIFATTDGFGVNSDRSNNTFTVLNP
jgi:hypothetical protein